MQRRRDIAASPVRRADEAWATIVALLADTLDRSDVIEREDVVDVLDAVATVGPRLIAARHLEKVPVVLVADPVHLSIYTISGSEAISLDENLNPVPGGSSATTWTIHLPTPEPLVADITAAVAKSSHLTVDRPSLTTAKNAEAAELLDLEALARQLSKDTA